MRSPTFTVKSWAEPGLAAPAPRPRSAALLGVFLEAQPAIASAATRAMITGFVVSLAMRRIPASPSHLSEFIELPVTTLRLIGVQETWLTFGFRAAVHGSVRCLLQLARTLGGIAAQTRRYGEPPRLSSVRIIRAAATRPGLMRNS